MWKWRCPAEVPLSCLLAQRLTPLRCPLAQRLTPLRCPLAQRLTPLQCPLAQPADAAAVSSGPAADGAAVPSGPAADAAAVKTWPASVLFWPPRTDLQVRAQEGLRGGGPAARVGRPTVARSEPYAKKSSGAAGRDQNNTEAGQFTAVTTRERIVPGARTHTPSTFCEDVAQPARSSSPEPFSRSEVVEREPARVRAAGFSVWRTRSRRQACSTTGFELRRSRPAPEPSPAGHRAGWSRAGRFEWVVRPRAQKPPDPQNRRFLPEPSPDRTKGLQRAPRPTDPIRTEV